MKYVVLISCLFALSYAGPPEVIDQLFDKVRKAGLDCKPEVGATDDDIAALKSHQIPSTTTGKCFIACLEKKLDFMTADGKFNKDVGYKFIAKIKDFDAELYGKVKNLADTCYAKVAEGPDACETGANMLQCVENEREANGIPNWEF